MEIIIRVEEKENPTVGAALREMASDYWVKTYLPQLIQAAKEGKTRKVISINIRASTAKLIEESFSKFGIKVDPEDCYWSGREKCYREIIFSWV